MRVWALALAFALVLAGCAGKQAPEDESQVTVKEPDGSQTHIKTKQGTGALTGQVIDDAGFPLPDVHVALLDTARFQVTTGNGTFLFPDLPPQTYRLRADAEGYQSAESDVKVEPDRAVAVEVRMLPLADVGAGYRPHMHDHWGPRTEITVIDQEVELPGDGPAGVASQPYTTACTGPNAVPLYLDEPNQLVVPGTGSLRVTIDWTDAQVPTQSMRFQYRGTNMSALEVTPDIPKATPHEIEVTRDNWDSSHQTFTLWAFGLCKPAELPRTATGTFHVKLDLVKAPGHVPSVDEPHPRFWQDGDRLVIVEDKGYDYAQLIHSRDRPTQPFSGGTPYYTGRFTIFPGDGAAHQGAAEGVLVPPGTARLEARLEWTYSDVTRGEAKPWSLSYRSADRPPWGLEPRDLVVPEPDEVAEGTKHYTIPVERGTTDAFYQKRSNWMFFFNLEGEEEADDYTSPCYPCGIEVRLTVHAVRDAEGSL